MTDYTMSNNKVYEIIYDAYGFFSGMVDEGAPVIAASRRDASSLDEACRIIVVSNKEAAVMARRDGYRRSRVIFTSAGDYVDITSSTEVTVYSPEDFARTFAVQGENTLSPSFLASVMLSYPEPEASDMAEVIPL